MQILQLTKQVPFPQHSGEAIAVENTATALKELGHSIRLFSLDTQKHSFPDDAEGRAFLRELYEKYWLHLIDTSLKLGDVISNLFLSDRSLHLLRFESGAALDILVKIIEEENIELLWVESLYMMHYAQHLKLKFDGLTIIYRSHNIEHLIWERIATNSSFLKSVYLKNQSRRLQREERDHWKIPDTIVAISEIDRTIIEKEANRQITTLEPTFHLHRSYRNRDSKDFKIGFLGAMDWMPNRMGLEAFLDSGFLKLDTDIQLVIAGRKSEKWNESKFKERVIVLGEIDQVEEFYNKVDLIIVPLLAGSGVRIKIIEAISYGLPVLATTIAVEGLDFKNDKQVAIEDDFSKWPGRINKLREDQSYSEKMVQNAQRLLLEKSSKGEILKKVKKILEVKV